MTLDGVLMSCSQTTLDDFAHAILSVDAAPTRTNSPVRTRRDSYFRQTSAFQSINRSPAPETDNKRIANVIIARNLDEAPRQIQTQALELMRTKRIFTRTSIQNAPKRFLFIAAIAGGEGPRLTKHLNDYMFISHVHNSEDGFPNLEELHRDDSSSASSVVKRSSTLQTENTPWAGISPMDIEHLAQQSQSTTVSVEVKQYQQNVASFLRVHRAVATGISAIATKHFDKLVRCLAPLHGLPYATPSLIALAARKIYPHRIEIVDAERERSMQWGSDLEAIRELLDGIGPEDVLEDVLGSAGAEAPLVLVAPLHCANGFIASWILDHLLKQGHSVRAIIRSQSKAQQVSSDFPAYQSHLDFGIVPDITTPGAFDEVVKSDPPFDIVIHTASPFLYKIITDNREFLDPSIKGTTGVLESVKKNAPGVSRVVLTSSCAAVVNFAGEYVSKPQRVYTESDWNPTTLESVLHGTQHNAYQASKKFAELAAWDFMEKERPDFDLVTLAPPMVYGPLRHSIKNMHDLNQSNARIYNGFINSSKDSELPPNGLHTFADVRDVAEAHLLAATLPEASGQRFIVCEGQISSQNISDILRKNIPELEERTPKGVPGDKGLADGSFTCSSDKVRKVLGLKFRSKEDTFVDLARQLLEFENAGE
ncbi:hypothetical protein DSL72_008425 [Monilinia vaccinii-corymbosi]|uniref:NAD-dependent epimerase/dehydratase domain-containing protein n=1 Tax=Monilinia vaccinii-corymbosi TaxID=61207 RepID=A0A8A3PKN1_9HELO|nr:hypothetical protein DSL72_008425 [Monilinia vaccinii-corymbosi]